MCLFLQDFVLFMLFSFMFMTLVGMTKQPSCMLLWKHICYSTTMARTFFVFHKHLFKSSLHHQINKQPLYELWELMVESKKKVLSRILVLSSLPHSRVLKRLSKSLISLTLQSSPEGAVQLRSCYEGF